MTTKISKAEQRARAWAKNLEGYGLAVEIRVSSTPAEYFSSGETMLQERTHAEITIRDEYLGVWGDYIVASWTSLHRASDRPELRATTHWSHGFWTGITEPGVHKFRNERAFARKVGGFTYRDKELVATTMQQEDKAS